MAIVVIRAALLHRAVDQGLDPTPGAIARAVGVSGRTMRRALAGAPISGRTQDAIRHHFGGDSLFRDCGQSHFTVTKNPANRVKTTAECDSDVTAKTPESAAEKR